MQPNNYDKDEFNKNSFAGQPLTGEISVIKHKNAELLHSMANKM